MPRYPQDTIYPHRMRPPCPTTPTCVFRSRLPHNAVRACESLIFHKRNVNTSSEASRHHICAIQAFEAFDTFEDIGEISSKGCHGTHLRLEDLALRGITSEPLGTPHAREARASASYASAPARDVGLGGGVCGDLGCIVQFAPRSL